MTQPADVSSGLKRRRAKIACEPCRERKRKCNGNQPCNTCSQAEYACYYKPPPRRKKTATQLPSGRSTYSQHPHPGHSDDDDPESASPLGAQARLRSLEANSGAAFVRRLGLKIDPNNAPRLHLFAWNVGERLASFGSSATPALPMVSIISQAEMRALALTFFDKVAPCYGFIDRDTFFERLGARWLTPSNRDSYDPVLCGVAAMGFLFSQKTPTATESHLVETARSILVQSSLSNPPSIDIVTAWVLRVAYLRMTALPHVTWLASCSLMHVVEAAGLHLELPSDTVFAGSTESCDPDIRRRLFGLAQHLNIWSSFDLGRTRVTLPRASTLPVSPKPGDYTCELLNLLPLSETLDPDKIRDGMDLESALIDVLDRDHSTPPLIMAQCNLMLCIYRRLRAQDSNIPNHLMDRILSLATRGLQAAQSMIANKTPWHHAANVPFQVVCMLLAIDSRASLSLLGGAMDTLRQVASEFESAMMREAYNTAYLLILLHQRRKDEDATTLRDILGVHSTAPLVHSTDAQFAVNIMQQPPASNASELIWLEDLIADMPSLREFDLEQFLLEDAPTQRHEPNSVTENSLLRM